MYGWLIPSLEVQQMALGRYGKIWLEFDLQDEGHDGLEMQVAAVNFRLCL